MTGFSTGCKAAKIGLPEWLTFPEQDWETITPEEAGLDSAKFNSWVETQKPWFGKAYGGQEPTDGGIVLTRGGYLLHTWGNPGFKYQSSSLGKTFTRMALQLAIDEGLIRDASDTVAKYWTGDSLLASHKTLNHGHHKTLTFEHLQNMTGGFPVTNGYFWRTRERIPSWASYTGDPNYDNYAHIQPGRVYRYSSGGYWRLAQALTSIWHRDLKDVLDTRIMINIGILTDRWEWLSGTEVHARKAFYPQMPGYGDYLDPPYDIDGIVVRGGPGWVIMGASDFARLGLLIATGGLWKQERLISKIVGNTGVGAHTVNGWGVVKPSIFSFPLLKGKEAYFSFGKVAADFVDPTPELLASWIVGPVKPNRASTKR